MLKLSIEEWAPVICGGLIMCSIFAALYIIVDSGKYEEGLFTVRTDYGEDLAVKIKVMSHRRIDYITVTGDVVSVYGEYSVVKIKRPLE